MTRDRTGGGAGMGRQSVQRTDEDANIARWKHRSH